MQVNGKKYSAQNSTLLADDTLIMRHRRRDERGRGKFLYRDNNSGEYFLLTVTIVRGEKDSLRPITQAEALQLFDYSLLTHYALFVDAFPRSA